MTIKMVDETMKPERATEILKRTSAAAALECVWYDTLEENPNLRHSEVRLIVERVLAPVNDYLLNPILTDDQFVAAPRSLDYYYGLIERNREMGQRTIVDRSDADNVFRNRRNFGAQSIDEFLTAIVVAENHGGLNEIDPMKLSLTGRIHHALNQAAEVKESVETEVNSIVEDAKTPAESVEDLGVTDTSKAEMFGLLKAQIKAELKDELKAEIKAEIKAELEAEKAPVRAEASAKLDQLLAQYRRPVG